MYVMDLKVYAHLTPVLEGAVSAGLTPVLEGAVSAGLTPVLEGHSACRFNSSPGGPQCLQV